MDAAIATGRGTEPAVAGGAVDVTAGAGEAAANIMAVARDMLRDGRDGSWLDFSLPGFDEAYAAATPEILGMSDDEALRAFDVNVRAHVMSRGFALQGEGPAMRFEATTFAIPVSGTASAVEDVLHDREGAEAIVGELVRRGVAHPSSSVALAMVPVTAAGLAAIGPAASWRLTEDLFGCMLADLLAAERGEEAPLAAMRIVAEAFAGHVEAPVDAPDGRILPVRFLVGVRLLSIPEGGARDYFSDHAGEAEAAEDDALHDAHELWYEAMQRRFADRDVEIGLPTTFTDAAAQAAASGVRDHLIAIAEETGWPMHGTCEEVHVVRDGDLTRAVFVRNGRSYGPVDAPTAAIAFDPDPYEEAVSEAMRPEARRVLHSDASTMPIAMPRRDGVPTPANDNAASTRH